MWIQKHCANIKPVVIDGAIAVSVAMLIAAQTYMANEEVFKYMNPYVIFYGKFLLGVIAAGLTALQYFRSKAYADHRQKIANDSVISSSKTIENKSNSTTIVEESKT